MGINANDGFNWILSQDAPEIFVRIPVLVAIWEVLFAFHDAADVHLDRGVGFHAGLGDLVGASCAFFTEVRLVVHEDIGMSQVVE